MSQQIEENSVKQLTLHWLYGLDEYFTHINHPQLEKYLAIKNALIHENIWKMQELAIGEVYRGPTENTEEFFHIIFSRLTGYENVTHRKVLNYISHCVDDDFLRRISYWSSICEKKANFNDHFSRGQIKSKIWLIEELNKILDNKNIGTLVHYGGWYATIAYFLFNNFNIDQYYNIEADKECVWIGDEFNYPQYNAGWKYKGIHMDVNEIKYNNNSFTAYTQNKQSEVIELDIKPNFILNTSCEHMDETWYNNLPEGSIVALQTNNYFSNEQHINCVGGVEEAIAKYPMSEVYYSGELDTQLYTRFMVIGKK